jgi:hypothetical protein
MIIRNTALAFNIDNHNCYNQVISDDSAMPDAL